MIQTITQQGFAHSGYQIQVGQTQNQGGQSKKFSALHAEFVFIKCLPTLARNRAGAPDYSGILHLAEGRGRTIRENEPAQSPFLFKPEAVIECYTTFGHMVIKPPNFNLLYVQLLQG